MGGTESGQIKVRSKFISSRLVRGIAIAVLAVAIGVPAAIASHDFPDVPTGHKFHEEIGAIEDAGFTTGYSNGDFGPEDKISRGAMAAFEHRGSGRAGMTTFTVVPTMTASEGEFVNLLFMDVPGVTEAFGDPVTSTQFVKLEYTTYFIISNTADVTCPCSVLATMGDLSIGPESIAFLDINEDEKGNLHSLSDSFLIEASPTGPHIYVNFWSVAADVGTLEIAFLTSIDGVEFTKMIGTTFPFGPFGSDEQFGALDARARFEREASPGARTQWQNQHSQARQSVRR